MSIAAQIALLWVAFAATHLGLASVRVEPRLRARLGDGPFLGLYSLVAAASFVPLCWIYFTNRHAGAWLWAVPVGPALRAGLYAGITVAIVLVAGALVRPSPAAVAPGQASVVGIYRVTRHPLVLGLALIAALHLVPNGSSADLAFFGGLVAFALLGARHQDARKLHGGSDEFRAFHAATGFLPFSRPGGWRGLAEIPLAVCGIGVVAALAIRWIHPQPLWP